MVQHGLAWFSMDYHGVAWCSMVWRGSAHGDRSSVVPPMIEPEVSRINGFGWVLTAGQHVEPVLGSVLGLTCGARVGL